MGAERGKTQEQNIFLSIQYSLNTEHKQNERQG
jgi:hypothetical protein